MRIPTIENPIQFKKTRKAFLVEYACGFFLFLLLMTGLITKLKVSPTVFYVMGGLSAITMGSAEFQRILTRYKILPTKLIVSHGIIQQKKKNVYFHPLGFVPDLNVKQTTWQRIFNVGTVFLKSGAESTFELKDINSPHKILELIETLIDKNRGSMTTAKGHDDEEVFVGIGL